MSKKRFFIPLAAFSLLFSTVVACNANNNNNNPSSSGNGGNPSTSQPAGNSSNGGGASASSNAGDSSSSQAPAHTHAYGETPKASFKNADDKDIKLFECSENDGGKMMTIAFGDFSEQSDAFDSAANASKYKEVDASLWDDAKMLAKSSNTTISWKVNVDKAITGAKLELGINSTYASHGSTDVAGKFQVKVNDGAFANWEQSGTYTSIGLAPTKRTYIQFATINLAAGENVITVKQANQENRLLFGGDVRIMYEGDALPVNAPATGYDITFVPAEHVKVKVYVGANELVETNKTQSVNADAIDADSRYVPAKYFAGVEDDPATEADETVAEIKPEVIFKLEFDEGYTADGNDISISGTMGNEWNKLCSFDDPDSYNITKIKAAITVTIAARAVTGNEKAGYVGTFSVEHGQLIVYQGAKNKNGDNLDTPDVEGKYLSRVSKTGEVSKTKAQFNFEIIPDEGYEFVSGLKLGGESSPTGVTNFVTGNFGNFKRDKTSETLYSITKIASDINLHVVCTLKAAA